MRTCRLLWECIEQRDADPGEWAKLTVEMTDQYFADATQVKAYTHKRRARQTMGSDEVWNQTDGRKARRQTVLGPVGHKPSQLFKRRGCERQSYWSDLRTPTKCNLGGVFDVNDAVDAPLARPKGLANGYTPRKMTSNIIVV